MALAESQAEDDIAEQLGIGGAAADAELDRLKECAEAEIMARAGLIGRFAPLVAEFCVRRCAHAFRPSLAVRYWDAASPCGAVWDQCSVPSTSCSTASALFAASMAGYMVDTKQQSWACSRAHCMVPAGYRAQRGIGKECVGAVMLHGEGVASGKSDEWAAWLQEPAIGRHNAARISAAGTDQAHVPGRLLLRQQPAAHLHPATEQVP